MTETDTERIAKLEDGQRPPPCPLCGNHRDWHEPPLTGTSRPRTSTAPPFAPRFKASPRCKSGGHPYCSCDICF